MAAGHLSVKIGEAWTHAMHSIPTSDYHHTLTDRAINGATAIFQSWAPAVLAKCHLIAPLSSADYPVAHLPVNVFFTGSISTQWISAPENGALSNGSSTTYMPSAFLFVDFPVSNMSSIAPTYTCTADARWVKAIYIQDTVGTAGIKLLRTTVFSQNNYQPSITAYDKNFLQIGDAIYRRVHMDMDWLNALTPPIFSNANNSFRSLAALLSDVGIDNSTGLVPQNKTLFPKEPLEAIVATIIADGMSRHGFAAN
ncbi:MAG: hypothetical protein LQ342_008574, partial [Letrouitia transgressa]